MDQNDPAPTVPVEIMTQSGKSVVEVLPDSGADICAAGYNFLHDIGTSPDHLSDSYVKPRTVNGSKLDAVGFLRAKVQLGHRSTDVKFHIYKGICGAVLSWKAAQALGILPQDYPKQQDYFLKDDHPAPVSGSKARNTSGRVYPTHFLTNTTSRLMYNSGERRVNPTYNGKTSYQNDYFNRNPIRPINKSTEKYEDNFFADPFDDYKPVAGRRVSNVSAYSRNYIY